MENCKEPSLDAIFWKFRAWVYFLLAFAPLVGPTFGVLGVVRFSKEKPQLRGKNRDREDWLYLLEGFAAFWFVVYVFGFFYRDTIIPALPWSS